MQRFLYFLNDSSNMLPKSIKLEIYIYSIGLSYYQIDRAVIKIQDGNVYGILSSVLLITPVYNNPFIDIFWG